MSLPAAKNVNTIAPHFLASTVKSQALEIRAGRIIPMDDLHAVIRRPDKARALRGTIIANTLAGVSVK